MSSYRTDLSQRLYLALIHHPIRDRLGEVVVGSLYTPDLHDISRTAKTYHLGGYFITHPVPSQRALCERMVRHWKRGHGAKINPNRGEALDVTRVATNLGQAIAAITAETGQQPVVLTTTARQTPHAQPLGQVRHYLEGGRPVLLVFGTGWGLAEDFLTSFDGVLEPIQGLGPYNHLSVRSAVAIILDRILGR